MFIYGRNMYVLVLYPTVWYVKDLYIKANTYNVSA